MRSYQHIPHHHHRQSKYVKIFHKCRIYSIHRVCFFPVVVCCFCCCWLASPILASQTRITTTPSPTITKSTFYWVFSYSGLDAFFRSLSLCANIFQCNNSERKPEKNRKIDGESKRRSKIDKKHIKRYSIENSKMNLWRFNSYTLFSAAWMLLLSYIPHAHTHSQTYYTVKYIYENVYRTILQRIDCLFGLVYCCCWCCCTNDYRNRSSIREQQTYTNKQ